MTGIGVLAIMHLPFTAPQRHVDCVGCHCQVLEYTAYIGSIIVVPGGPRDIFLSCTPRHNPLSATTLQDRLEVGHLYRQLINN